jgi:hypothetical protein
MEPLEAVTQFLSVAMEFTGYGGELYRAKRTWTGPTERSEGAAASKGRAEESLVAVCPDGIVIMSMVDPVRGGSLLPGGGGGGSRCCWECGACVCVEGVCVCVGGGGAVAPLGCV